jgi:hypothetical protein
MKQPSGRNLSERSLAAGLNRKKVFSGILLAAAALWFAQTSFILPLKTDNGEFFVANYVVQEEDFDHPRLRLLRKREKLDEVMAAGETQFDKLVLLRKWTNRQWEHKNGRFYYPPWDALEILDLARRHGNRGFCAQYAVVFLQACLSVGRHARYIDLPGHFVVGVWSDGFSKWVVMDPYNDLHYEKNGIPLNGMELYEAYHRRGTDGIFEVKSDGARKPVSPEEISLYREYAVDMRNNHLSDPLVVRVNGSESKLTLSADYTAYPLAGKDEVQIDDFFLTYRPPEEAPQDGRIYTEDSRDFKRNINQTIIYFMKSTVDSQAVKIVLLTDDAPTIRTFQINPNDGGWRDAPSKLMWELDPGINRLEARVMTKFGWMGRPSSITLYYKSPWLLNAAKRREASRNLPKSI